MGNPLVSVIVTYFNAVKYLEEAIQSVIGQTYDNWELILIDDGSTDDSISIASKYSDSFPYKIFIYHHPDNRNKGISASRNLGIEKAKGVYITFLDSDDIYLNDKLDAQIKLISQYQHVGIVFSATKYWYSWNKLENDREDFVQTLETPTGIYPPGKLFKYILLKKAAVPCMGGVIVKRELLNSFNGFEEEFKGMYEDQVFYTKASLNSYVFVDNNFYDLYRQHKESCCSVAEENNSVIEARKKYLNWLKDYLKKMKVEDEQIQNALKRELLMLDYPAIGKRYERIKSVYRKIKNKIIQ